MIARVLALFGHDLARQNGELLELVNRKSHEITKLNVEIRAMRHRFAEEFDSANSAGLTAAVMIEQLRDVVRKLEVALADSEWARAFLKTRADELGQQLVEAAGTIEEVTTRLAITEQQNRDLLASIETLKRRLMDADLDEQLVLMHSPAAATSEVADGGGEFTIEDEAKPELISDSTPEGVSRVLGIFFVDRRYWLLSRDEGKASRITAAMHDKEFVARLHKRLVTFTDGDSLRVKLNTKTWRRPDGSLFTQYAITEVLEVLAPPQQLDLQPAAAPVATGASS